MKRTAGLLCGLAGLDSQLLKVKQSPRSRYIWTNAMLRAVAWSSSASFMPFVFLSCWKASADLCYCTIVQRLLELYPRMKAAEEVDLKKRAEQESRGLFLTVWLEWEVCLGPEYRSGECAVLNMLSSWYDTSRSICWLVMREYESDDLWSSWSKNHKSFKVLHLVVEYPLCVQMDTHSYFKIKCAACTCLASCCLVISRGR